MKSYIFDIGGVLINFDNRRLLENIAVMQHCEPDDLRDIFQSDWVYRVESGKISSLEYFETHVRKFLPGISFHDWITAWMENYSINQPGMLLMEQIKEMGHPTYLLSNLAEHHQIAIERKFDGFFRRCDRNFFSYQLGLFKPDLEIFREVCRQIDQKPGDCIFFDDSAANVKGAVQAGMIAFQFSNERVASISQEISAHVRLSQAVG